MALISSNTRYRVKMLRNVLVSGKGRVAGDIVEVDLDTQRKLIAMGMAVAHTQIAEKIKSVAEKTAEKLRGSK